MKKLSILILTLILSLNVFSPKATIEANESENFNIVNLEEELKLNPLPYESDSLEPYIDADTLTIHHENIEQEYINKLNLIVENTPKLKEKSLYTLLSKPNILPKELREKFLDAAGAIYNHEFFWSSIISDAMKTPSSNIGDAINKQYGSFDNFKNEFEKVALNILTPGWIWLVSDNHGNLSIISTSNNNTPIGIKKYPIICLDLWEHAYYLKYQDRKIEYIKSFWNISNWEFAEKNYINALKNTALK